MKYRNLLFSLFDEKTKGLYIHVYVQIATFLKMGVYINIYIYIYSSVVITYINRDFVFSRCMMMQ